ncbi:uncharacterized protein YMR317W [Scaptodrosophila lebanonensis]|uniref:Uncharacterized protein YMR317W n=1 Tax=Drosophila lebanonensis TaxID=7225 RepID=A0A6J2U948_DROLE|nr:uncharacterized protein YMR317W [Scaptodrosophila lebanonensis]
MKLDFYELRQSTRSLVMRAPKMKILLLVMFVGGLLGVGAQDNFEDADKSNEYTDQEFDLRHTIPGEPGVDYPILSTVPKTSFVCQGRHEGYYADVESRCQAFRICAHTARSAQGFGFLCPNGTLFSQKHFVCDWYRNVNCDESEQYYEKNMESTVGSTHDMMERVRQMMEYPMKTITKALQQGQGEAPILQSKRIHQSLSKDLSHESGVLSKPAAVKPISVDQVQVTSDEKSARGEAVKSEPLSITSEGDDIYVNSLGELSSDPGINFDHTNAHIIAEYPREYHYKKQMNFAERVNSGLNELSDLSSNGNENEVLAPEYIKQIRNTNEEATQLDLVSNINNLLDEVSTDLDPSVSGYQAMAPQKVKQPFRFLSRGFATQGKGTTSYVYNRPKQTESTVRFTPNEIPIDTHKDSGHKLKLGEDKSSTTSTTEAAPHDDEYVGEYLLIAPTLSPADEAEAVAFQITTTPTPEPDLTDATPEISTTIATNSVVAVPLGLLEPPILPSTDDINEFPAIESIGQAAALTAAIPEEGVIGSQAKGVELNDQSEKVDVNQQAEKLLLAGVKLTSHDGETNNLSADATTIPVVAAISSTPAMSTSTETVTEISSTQERIRGYRRNSQKQRAGEAATLKRQHHSQLYERRTNLRPLVRSTTPRSTTPRTTTTTTTSVGTTLKPTRSYLERLAASRLRLSRLSAATRHTTSSTSTTTSTSTPSSTSTTTTTTPSPLAHVRGGADSGPNKKLTVRNIEKDTSSVNLLQSSDSKATWESVHSNLQRFQVQRGNRVYTPATRSTPASNTTPTTIQHASRSTTEATPVRSSANRGRNRYNSYKTQVQRTRGTTTPRTTSRTTAATTTTTPVTPQRTTPTALSTLAQQISALASNYNHGYSYTATSVTQAPRRQPNAAQINNSNNIHINDNTHNTPAQTFAAPIVSGTQDSSSAFLPFDKLTRAIVDDSNLQNFKVTHTKATPSRGPSTYQAGRPQQRVAKPSVDRIAAATVTNSYSYLKPVAPVAAEVPQVKPPGIVIARAEGQRIQPNSVSNVISSLVRQPQVKVTQSSSYVSLNDFLNNKFRDAGAAATLQQQQQQQHQQQQQQHQQQQQQHQQLQQQQPLQQQQQQQLSFIAQQYQQHQQYFHQAQQRPTIQSIQQPYLTPNIFVPYQQQQQLLPQFPPLTQVAAEPATYSVIGNSRTQNTDRHLNVQLPALANGLIPAPTLQVAQRRSDPNIAQLKLGSRADKGRETDFYRGATSYEVAQNSVGRLPNDITHQMRRRVRHY